MHEFSIIQNIIEIVLDAAKNNQINHVSSVEMDVGDISGVETEALRFAWENARKDTILDKTSLVINRIPLRVSCGICHAEYMPTDLFEPCPACKEINPEIITGKELRVVAIET